VNVDERMETLFYIPRDISIDSIESIFNTDKILVQVCETLLEPICEELRKQFDFMYIN